jgi:OOP family OmpA-OmpF porin
MPGEPPEGSEKDSVWGNRGVLFQGWERRRPEEPPVVAQAPVPEPPITFAVIPQLAPVKIEKVTVRERIVLENVLFDLDKAELKPEGKARVDKAAGYLTEYQTDRVIIEGHACALGTEEHNLALGMRRAEAVKKYLVERGVASERIRSISYGESQPVADNFTEEGRELNRRAVIEIVEGR